MKSNQTDLILDTNDLSKSFGTLKVLKNISLQAKQHEVISVLGRSGSGKSTLLRCLAFLEIAERGSVAINGTQVDLSALATRNRAERSKVQGIRKQIGFVFQSFNLWSHMSVLDNIMLSPMHVLGLSKAEATERAEALLHKVDMYERRHYFPNKLSGGQKQRAAIARALAMDPSLLLFDEPTSALDPELVNEVLVVMRNLAEEGRTMIVVTHEMRFARDVSSRTMFFQDGEVAFDEASEEAFRPGFDIANFDQFVQAEDHAP